MLDSNSRYLQIAFNYDTRLVLHLGRDEESTHGKMIQYRHVNRVRSKFASLISAAGAVGLKEARSAIFNGADIVVVSLVRHPRRPLAYFVSLMYNTIGSRPR